MSQSILITGCSTGIGLCAAQTLQQKGFRVFATARKPQNIAHLQQLGLETIALDVNDSVSIEQAVATVLERTQGKIDALLNNAGYGQMAAVEDLTRDDLRQQFETNVFGLQELTNLIIPAMRRQGHGRIINISSILGLVSMPYRGAYNASKFAVEALSTALRLELRGSNIFVSVVEPGPIVSQFRETAISRAPLEKFANSPHAKTYEKMLQQTQDVKNKAPFTLGPEAVVAKILQALTSPRPKAHYYVTKATYLLATLNRLLPTALMDQILLKTSR